MFADFYPLYPPDHITLITSNKASLPQWCSKHVILPPSSYLHAWTLKERKRYTFLNVLFKAFIYLKNTHTIFYLKSIYQKANILEIWAKSSRSSCKVKRFSKNSIYIYSRTGLHSINKRVNPLILGVWSFHKSAEIKNKKLTPGYTCNM